MRKLVGEEALTGLANVLDHVEIPPAASSSSTTQVKNLVKASEESTRPGATFKETTPSEKQALKKIFGILMSASPCAVKETLDSILQRYNAPSSQCITRAEEKLIPLVKQLNSQFPGDIGILCCYMLNVVELEVGKSVFLKADEPHAYISGGESAKIGDWKARVADQQWFTSCRHHRVYGNVG